VVINVLIIKQITIIAENVEINALLTENAQMVNVSVTVLSPYPVMSALTY
jgi:hypothetical protein